MNVFTFCLVWSSCRPSIVIFFNFKFWLILEWRRGWFSGKWGSPHRCVGLMAPFHGLGSDCPPGWGASLTCRLDVSSGAVTDFDCGHVLWSWRREEDATLVMNFWVTWRMSSILIWGRAKNHPPSANWLVELRSRAEDGCPGSVCRVAAFRFAGTFFIDVILVSVSLMKGGESLNEGFNVGEILFCYVFKS